MYIEVEWGTERLSAELWESLEAEGFACVNSRILQCVAPPFNPEGPDFQLPGQH